MSSTTCRSKCRISCPVRSGRRSGPGSSVEVGVLLLLMRRQVVPIPRFLRWAADQLAAERCVGRDDPSPFLEAQTIDRVADMADCLPSPRQGFLAGLGETDTLDPTFIEPRAGSAVVEAREKRGGCLSADAGLAGDRGCVDPPTRIVDHFQRAELGPRELFADECTVELVHELSRARDGGRHDLPRQRSFRHVVGGRRTVVLHASSYRLMPTSKPGSGQRGCTDVGARSELSTGCDTLGVSALTSFCGATALS